MILDSKHKFKNIFWMGVDKKFWNPLSFWHKTNYLYSRFMQNLCLSILYDTQKKIFQKWKKKPKSLNCDICFKCLLQDRHQILSMHQNCTTNKRLFFPIGKKPKSLNCDICTKSLSEDLISEIKFNLSNNFSELFF